MLSYPFDLCFFGLWWIKARFQPAWPGFSDSLDSLWVKGKRSFLRMLVGSWFYSCLWNRERSISCPTLSDPRLVPAGLRGREKSICCVASPLDWPVHPSPCLNVSPSLFFERGADRGAFVHFISIFFCILYEDCTAFCSCWIKPCQRKKATHVVSYFDFVWL